MNTGIKSRVSRFFGVEDGKGGGRGVGRSFPKTSGVRIIIMPFLLQYL